jgi:hypothetical protein
LLWSCASLLQYQKINSSTPLTKVSQSFLNRSWTLSWIAFHYSFFNHIPAKSITFGGISSI